MKNPWKPREEKVSRKGGAKDLRAVKRNEDCKDVIVFQLGGSCSLRGAVSVEC